MLTLMLFMVNVLTFAQNSNVTVEKLRQQYNYQYLVELDYVLPPFNDISFGLSTYMEEMKPPVLLSVLQDGKVICDYGAILENGSGRYVLYDLDGDGVLEFKTTTKDHYIPNWILFKAKMKRRYPKDFLKICNDFYEGFNSINGPSRQKTVELINTMKSVVDDKNAYNRDIYYALLSYYLIPDRNEFRNGIIYSLQKHISINYNGESSPLFFLFFGETFMSAGRPELARSMFEGLKEYDNKSLIADFYIAKIDDGLSKTNKNISQFMKKYPNFWALKK
jgi:hypothetical protein